MKTSEVMPFDVLCREPTMESPNFKSDVNKENGSNELDDSPKPDLQLELNEDPYLNMGRPRAEIEENNPYSFDAFIPEDFVETGEITDFSSITLPYEPSADAFKSLDLNRITQDSEGVVLDDFSERGATGDSASANYLDTADECLSLYGIIPASDGCINASYGENMKLSKNEFFEDIDEINDIDQGFNEKINLSECELMKGASILPHSPKSDAIFCSSENSCLSLPVAQNIDSCDYGAQIGLQDNIVEKDQEANDKQVENPSEIEENATLVTPTVEVDDKEDETNEDGGDNDNLYCGAAKPKIKSKRNAVKSDAEQDIIADQDGNPSLGACASLGAASGNFGERDGSSDGRRVPRRRAETAEELKEKAKYLIKANYALSHKLNGTMKSLDNQNKEIKYLQETITSIDEQTQRQTDQLCLILGSETLRVFDNIIRYKMIIDVLGRVCDFDEDDREMLNELQDVVDEIPNDCVNDARHRCASFLREREQAIERCRRRAQRPNSGEASNQNATGAKPKKFPTRQSQKKKSQNQKKGQASACSGNDKKMSIPKLSTTSEQDVKEVKPQQFPSGQSSKKAQKRKKKAQAVESGSNSENDTCHDKTPYPNSSKTSEEALYEIQPKTLPHTKKTRAEANKESGLNIASNKKIPMKKAEANKKMQSTSDYSNEIEEVKNLRVTLTDFMKDPSADKNPLVAQYKQQI